MSKYNVNISCSLSIDSKDIDNIDYDFSNKKQTNNEIIRHAIDKLSTIEWLSIDSVKVGNVMITI